MIDEKTGYIKLQRFARTTYSEFMDAARSLKEQGMEHMVLDLRNNVGGFMDMAIRISDEFISGDKVIVSARSRHRDFNSENRAHVKGMLEDMPVILLVNEQSASASEIVAGALQDHDRALIVGRRTFGKGLVQKQFPFKDGSVLRMTISRYYTPSGRFIQTPYDSGARDDYYKTKFERHQSERALSAREIMDQIPDSLKYKTDAGRTVIGGGGILPDYVVRRDSASLFVQAVLGKRYDLEFARAWVDRNGGDFHDEWIDRQEAFLNDFVISDATFSQFEAFLAEKGIQITEGAKAVAGDDEKLRVFTRNEVSQDEAWMKNLVKAHIATRMFGQSAWYPVRHEFDETLIEAMQLWNSMDELLAHHE
jgi:carboxyl-terminal processing protease